MTARPLDPFTLPPSRPTLSMPPTSHASGGTLPCSGTTQHAITNSAIAVSPSPVSSTVRSPQRSVSKPQGNSLMAMPSPSAPNATPSSALPR